MKVLFDLRDHPEQGFVQRANERLATARPEYVERFGTIGSDVWWQYYDSHRITRTVHAGQITHLGPVADDFDEYCDIVRVLTDRRELEYDRESFWLDSALKVGSWVWIESVKAIVQTATGPVIMTIDIKVCLDESG